MRARRVKGSEERCAFVWLVSEEDCGEKGEGFEDVGLEGRDLDMTENNVGELTEKAAPSKIYSSRGIPTSSVFDTGSVATEHPGLPFRTDTLRVASV